MQTEGEGIYSREDGEVRLPRDQPVTLIRSRLGPNLLGPNVP